MNVNGEDRSTLRSHIRTMRVSACPAGALLWLQEQRQETPCAQRLVFCAPLEACQPCHLREQCLGRGAQGNRARRVSAVRRLLPLSRSPCQREGTLLAIRWVDMPGRTIRRHWIRHWRTQVVEVVPLSEKLEKPSPPARPPRAVRRHQRLSWKERLDRNARWGPPRVRLHLYGVGPALTSRLRLNKQMAV